jgi:2-succinyl-5-enolpyruvyl-6-hydroxy-3-cyclohexene-1-carboxylate synthase
MTVAAKNLNQLWASLLVEELVRCGVDRFVLSPGSRCTPLTLAVAEHPRTSATTHYDERGAAYFALGEARALRRPVALICTSGTAAANYLPAIVEASQSLVPLIVLTADRPPELLDTGANQTIDQIHLYGNYARWYHALPCPDRAIPPEAVLTAVDCAVHSAQGPHAGPVHLNCAYREPLAPIPTGENFSDYLASVATWQFRGKPYTTYARTGQTVQAEDERFLWELLQSAKRGLIVAGQIEDEAVSDAVRRLGQSLGWPIVADAASGLRLGTSGATVLHYSDLLLCSELFREWLAPDVMLRFGGPVTSKRLLQHLESCTPEHYIRIAHHPLRHDPIHRVTLRIQTDPAAFCIGLASACRSAGNTTWLDDLLMMNEKAGNVIRNSLSRSTECTEPGVVRHVSELAEDSLFLGNSMPIRDMDMFGVATGRPVRVFANRGASGIDGNIATAAGIAHASGKPVTAVIGDLAALHDLNSLALLRDRKTKVVLIVINNDGGGIFHFLPIAEHTKHFEQYFGTPHGMRFAHAAEQFGIKYACPGDHESFVAAYEAACEIGESSIIEVSTGRESNLRIHRELQAAVVASLATQRAD